MGTRCWRLGLLALVHGVVLCSGHAAAREAVPSFRLSLVRADAAGSCPSEREIAERVVARLGRNPFDDDALQSIEGTLSRDGSSFRAELRVRDEHGLETGRRSFDATGPDCTALADAVTLAVALVIDPDAGLAPTPPPLAESPPPLSESPPPLPAPCPVRTCPPAPPVAPAAPPPETPVDVTATLRAIGAVGLLPGLAPGIAVAGSAGGKVRAAAGVLYLSETVDDDQRFRFGLSSAFGGLCGTVAAVEVADLGLCGALGVGAVHAVVERIVPLDPGDRLWLALLAGPELTLRGPGPLRFELGVVGVVPLYRPSFEVRGFEGRIFQSAEFGGIFCAGLGVAAP